MKSTQKNLNLHAQHQPQRQKAKRHLFSIDWRRGLASGLMQILSFASGLMQILALGNAKIYQHVGIFYIRGRKSVALGV